MNFYRYLALWQTSSSFARALRCFPMLPTGSNLYVPCIKSRATNERLHWQQRTGAENASRVIDPPLRSSAPLRSAPHHAAWYLGRGWPLVRLPKTFLFFLLGPPRLRHDRNSRETAARIARQPARNWFHPEKSHWVASKRGAYRAFKTGSICVCPFEETDIFAERTDDTIRRDATRRDARRWWFRAFEPAEVSIERARERALLTYSRYCTIATPPVPASILFTTTKRSHDARERPRSSTA